MGLLKPAVNQTAYLKAGVMGFQGSGKTFTSSLIAEGLLKYFKYSPAKLAWFDTEKSSDFFVDKIKDKGIEFSVVKSRAFKDLCETIREAEKSGYQAIIVDSVTHVWTELLKSYGVKTGTKDFLRKLQPCKTEWEQFTELFINSKMHFISLGRAGYVWERIENEETGKKELQTTGTKFKAEGEFGYESDLLIEMERLEDKNGKDIHRCWVRKDRWDLLDGKICDDPTFDFFLPIVKKLGKDHFGFDEKRTSADMFGSPDYSYSERIKQCSIALEQLNEILILNGLDGTSVEAKKKRTELLIEVYGTSSKTALENTTHEEIRSGIEKIKTILNPQNKEVA